MPTILHDLQQVNHTGASCFSCSLSLLLLLLLLLLLQRLLAERVGEKSARLNISETWLNLSVRIALIASSALNYGNPLNLEGHLRRGGIAVLRPSAVREERVGEKSVRRNISKTRLNLDVGIAPNEQDQRSLLSVPCTLRPCTPTTLNPKP